MQVNFRIALLMICFAGGAHPTLAHHSLMVEFDLDHSVKLTGTLTKVEWGNPHALLFVDVRNLQNGKILNWALQLPSPTTLARLGWPREPFQPGIAVIVNGFPARDGSQKGSVQHVLASDGRTLFAAISDQNKDPAVRR